MTRIGVLALQGAFAEHIASLRRLGVEAVEIRHPEQLDGLDGLIIPGGESTTIGKLLGEIGFRDLADRLRSSLPAWGTCAGAILMAKRLEGQQAPNLGVMDIVVQRNAYGSQVDSFELQLPVPMLGAEPFPAVFIRAPRILEAGPGVEVLARLDDGTIVAARQGHLLVTAFHPELTPDDRWHRYFLEQIVARRAPARVEA